MTTGMEFKSKLKAELWRRFGHKDYPSEWDGNLLGGGKLSQRFWEYFQAIELLDLSRESVLLDIGGGSPVTGAGFFAATLAPHIKQVHILDVSIDQTRPADKNIVYHRQLATYDSICALLRAHPEITHAASISVFEHIEESVRLGIIKGVNDAFAGDVFVATLEYHTKECFFEYQLTARTLSRLFEPFTNFYLETMAKAPVHAESAYTTGLRTYDFKQHTWMWRIGWCLRLFGLYKPTRNVQVPTWYPLALKFARAS